MPPLSLSRQRRRILQPRRSRPGRQQAMLEPIPTEPKPGVIPVYILFRDWWTPLPGIVEFVRKTGGEPHIIDNASTDAGALEYLKYAQSDGVTIHRNAENHHNRAGFRFSQKTPWAMTDGDLGFADTDPSLLTRCLETLSEFPHLCKVGCSLDIYSLLPNALIDPDLPAQWESKYWQDVLKLRPADGTVYAADIDTTFAVYRGDGQCSYGPAARLGSPFMARHLPWHLTREQALADPSFLHFLRNARTDGLGWTPKLKEALADVL